MRLALSFLLTLASLSVQAMALTSDPVHCFAAIFALHVLSLLLGPFVAATDGPDEKRGRQWSVL